MKVEGPSFFSVFVKSTQDKQVYGFLRLDPFAHGVGHQQQKVRFINDNRQGLSYF